jgi:hypothetical protein
VYEVAAAFNETLTTLADDGDDAAPVAADASPAEETAPAVETDAPASDADQWPDVITTVTATVTQSSDELREIFNGNDW